MEDLFQIGSIGLLKAVDHFNPEFDVKFSTYAVPMIIGEIKRFLRDDGILKVSRSIKENQYRIYKMREKLEKKLGREPELQELSVAMDMPVEEIAITMESSAEVESIYRTVYQGGWNQSAAGGQASREGGSPGEASEPDFSGRNSGKTGGRGTAADRAPVFSGYDTNGGGESDGRDPGAGFKDGEADTEEIAGDGKVDKRRKRNHTVK